ncbi:MAG: hypothetical protein ACLSAZ_15370 [Blautia wexlerae]
MPPVGMAACNHADLDAEDDYAVLVTQKALRLCWIVRVKLLH